MSNFVLNRIDSVGGTANTLSIATETTAFLTTSPNKSNASNIVETEDNFSSIFSLPFSLGHILTHLSDVSGTSKISLSWPTRRYQQSYYRSNRH